MCEWRSAESAPKDGTEILLYTDSHGRMPYVIAFWKYSWINYASDYEITANILGWMPLPPRPPKKKHLCKDDNLTCTSYPEKNLFHIYTKKYDEQGEDLGWYVVGEYLYCPFCGEQSEWEDE